jgi:hypothetical protein
MAAKVSAPVRAIAEHGQVIGSLLKAKLMAQLTPEQRDILSTLNELVELNDAVFAGVPNHIVRKPPTNLTHARIVAEVKHGEQLLTGCDWRRINREDIPRLSAEAVRAGLEDK